MVVRHLLPFQQKFPNSTWITRKLQVGRTGAPNRSAQKGFSTAAVVFAALFALPLLAQREIPERRLVILKVDGMNADLLRQTMRETDPATGKSRLPWFTRTFAENGAIFENFYTRGISLSAPSWSMLDTGHHTVIRGNVEYDRFTGHVYDYLNFFPFYLGYAHRRHIDMPGVEVLDRAGIPLLIDAFPYAEAFQSFGLFQRGVRWTSLQHAAERRFTTKALLSTIEAGGGPSLDSLLQEQTEQDLKDHLKKPEIFYLDFFTGDVDHEGHATSQPAALLAVLRRLDALAGRLWTAIQESPLAKDTLLVVVSDHGMNNVPGIYSQGFSLPDLLNSPAGGAHHVLTNRHQLQDYKLAGLDPLVSRVTNPSTASFYLNGEAKSYPTAWLDLDGNERASVCLRNSELNAIHILLLQLAAADLPPALRRAAAEAVTALIDRHRAAWTSTANTLDEELRALAQAIEERKKMVALRPRKWTDEQHDRGEDKVADRLSNQLDDWEREYSEYTSYVSHLHALLALQPDAERPFKRKISDLLPESSLGDNNTVADLENYVVGPAPGGLVLDTNGHLDGERSFRRVNYFSLLASQRIRNNPQAALSPRPIDFTAMRAGDNLYWLYGDEQSQLLIRVDHDARIQLEPVLQLGQDELGKPHWIKQAWRDGLPLHLFEDPNLHLPPQEARSDWLSAWHTEQEWMNAIHQCEYSNGVLGVIEELSPVAANVPGTPALNPLLLGYERRRRELVQPDFQVFAANHWNFNVRNFNPGGNHGSFLRISTHSVWMMSGAGVPEHQIIQQPCDSLNFASTLLHWAGRRVPSPDRVISY